MVHHCDKCFVVTATLWFERLGDRLSGGIECGVVEHNLVADWLQLVLVVNDGDSDHVGADLRAAAVVCPLAAVNQVEL